MQNFEIFDQKFYSPLAKSGYTHPFWNLNIDTIAYTWVVLFVVILLIFVGRYALTRKKSILYFIISYVIREFKTLTIQTLGIFHPAYFNFVASLLTFILLCNTLSLFPWFEEPTTDVNTTLALGITSFIYIQASSIRNNGIKNYIKEYFSPFFLLFPLNVIGELATVISISFRLFGNIFGGSIIARLWGAAIGGSPLLESIGILSGINLTLTVFFGIFEGLIQAFVFAMLSLTYLSMTLNTDEPTQEELS